MVRVISVHHFSKQYIHTVEQPTATAIAPPDRLLLALSSHCIEVRDLSMDGDVLFSFPTVDEVRQIIHCVNGDYIATLETKCNRQNYETFYVRIYANWDSVATLQQSKMTSSGVSLGLSECGMVQPMRARIAGRVTPTTNQSEVCSLEMIELPVKRKPNMISCCQVSGNILILSSRHLMIYKFVVRSHDISKLRFIDFEELSLMFELNFKPTQITLCENYIGCMNDTCVHLFTVAQMSQNESSNADRKTEEYNYHIKNEKAPLNYKQMLLEEEMYNCNSITVNLPSVIKENSAIHKHCPFTCCDTEMTVNIKSSSPIDNWSHNYQINNLLQLKLKPIIIEGAHRQITEEFKCLVLKPLYVPNSHRSKKSETGKKPLLKSDYNYCFNSVACMLATQQEGYLYVFCDNSDSTSHADNCVAVYPFTAPVYKIVLEDYVLHALTETGLESYTLRIGHQLARNVHKVNNINVACPNINEPVCLVGLRPFLGVEQLLLSDNFLVLLANSEGSPTHSISSTNSNSLSWTLYNLELPTPLILYNDFVQLADVHQFSSPQTYCHLISEAHIILKITLMHLKWKNKLEHGVNLIVPCKNDNEDLSVIYKDSCRLLGDYYVMCTDESEYILSLPYYKMSQISPLEVLKRVQEIQNISRNNSMVGLLYYLKTVLLQIKTWTEADVLFTLLGEQNFIDTVLDLFSKYDPGNLSTLVLKNNVLREFATDKLINIFLQNKLRENNDSIALSVLYLQQYKHKEAKEILDKVSSDAMYSILIVNWELLFDTTVSVKTKDSGLSFSELTTMLMSTKPQLLADLIAYLITDLRAVSLDKILKVFLEFLPSHISKEGCNSSVVLQILLEKYFKNYYSLPENVYKKTNYDGPTFESLKILVRTYLSQLQIWQLNEKDKQNTNKKTCDASSKQEIVNFLSEISNGDLNTNIENNDLYKISECDEQNCKKLLDNEQNEDFLFSKIRWAYLDQVPPFCEDEMIKLMKMGNVDKINRNMETDQILKKLQALLCSQLIPKQVINEMLAFFKINASFKGNISLQSIVLPIKEGILYLLDKCPQCILQYSKDRFTKDDEWTFLIIATQQKISTISKSNNRTSVSVYYLRLLKDVLTYLATNIPLQRFLQLLPEKSLKSSPNTDENERVLGDKECAETLTSKDLECGYEPEADVKNNSADAEPNPISKHDSLFAEVENYDPYILICKQTMHANHIKRLIVATGQKLLTTLNL